MDTRKLWPSDLYDRTVLPQHRTPLADLSGCRSQRTLVCRYGNYTNGRGWKTNQWKELDNQSDSICIRTYQGLAHQCRRQLAPIQWKIPLGCTAHLRLWYRQQPVSVVLERRRCRLFGSTRLSCQRRLLLNQYFQWLFKDHRRPLF